VAQFFILVFHVLVSLEGTHSLMIQAYDDEGVVCGALVSCAITDARTIQQLPGLLDLHDGIVRGPMLNRCDFPSKPLFSSLGKQPMLMAWMTKLSAGIL
jgi:hypothetical protein